MRRMIPLALVALSAACAVGPGYRRPALALPDGWRPAGASADSSWELDLLGRIRRGTQAARADLTVREEDRRALELSLIGEVATAYFDLRASDLNLAIARRTLDSRQETLRLARQRLEQGLI